jgi:HSP20 family protein
VDIDMGTSGHEVIATFELPGVQKQDVHIEVHNSVLTISGEKSKHKEKIGNLYSVHERNYGKFIRSLQLPQNTKVRTFLYIERLVLIDHSEQLEDIKASMEDGVLTLVFPNNEHDLPVAKVSVS